MLPLEYCETLGFFRRFKFEQVLKRLYIDPISRTSASLLLHADAEHIKQTVESFYDGLNWAKNPRSFETLLYYYYGAALLTRAFSIETAHYDQEFFQNKADEEKESEWRVACYMAVNRASKLTPEAAALEIRLIGIAFGKINSALLRCAGGRKSALTLEEKNEALYWGSTEVLNPIVGHGHNIKGTALYRLMLLRV